MAAADKKPATILPFRRGDDDVEEIKVSRPVARPPAAAAESEKGCALAGPPCVFEIGRGKTGKSTFARWAGERMTREGRKALIAAIDAGNRSLADYFPDVEQPTVPDPGQPGGRLPSHEPVVIEKFLRDIVSFLMRSNEKPAALLDLGGNDQALPMLVETVPTLAADLEAAGVGVVALYFVGHSEEDLTPLATLEERGFQPQATAIVLNTGTVPLSMTTEEAFARVRRNSVFKAAVARGARVIEMPRLNAEAAQAVEIRRLHFSQAAAGIVPPGRRFSPVGGLARASINPWLAKMDVAFAPIAHWLP